MELGEELKDMRERYLPRGLTTAHPVVADHAQGSELWDTAGKRYIDFAGGFHGRTLLALSLTGTVNPYKQNFGPYATEVYQAPYPYEYRGWSSERAMGALHELLQSTVSPERVAAVIIEPVLGEGGFVPAPFEFLRELRA